jgi:hypothetical protein
VVCDRSKKATPFAFSADQFSQLLDLIAESDRKGVVLEDAGVPNGLHAPVAIAPATSFTAGSALQRSGCLSIGPRMATAALRPVQPSDSGLWIGLGPSDSDLAWQLDLA